MLNPQIISENIVYLRQRMGLTQQELAARANVTHQAVSKWENGSSIPDLQTLMTLSRLFGVTLDELLTEVLADRRGVEAAPVIEEEPAPAKEEEPAPAEEPQPRPERDAPRVDLHALVALAPFTPRDKLAQLVLSQRESLTLDALVPLAPFLGRQEVDRIVSQMDMTGVSPNHLVALAPFLSRDALEDAVSRMDSEDVTPGQLAALAPFLGRNALGGLVRGIGQLPMKALTMLAPFLSRETIGEQLEGLQNQRGAAEDPRPAGEKKSAPSSNDRLALRLAEDGDFDEIRELLPFLKRETVSQVIDMALDEDDLDFVMGSAFDMLPGAEQKKIALHMAENGDFDEMSGLFNHLNGETQARIVAMALDQDETDFLRAHIHSLPREVRQSVALRLAENGEFDELRPFFPALDEEIRETVIDMALDADDLDFLRGHGELIPDGVKRKVALRLAEEDEFSTLSRLIPLESLDEVTLNRLAELAREQDEGAFLRRVNLIRGAARQEEPEEAHEATDAASAMAAAREGNFAALPGLFDRLTETEKDEAVRLAIVYDDTAFLNDLIDDLPRESLETLCFALARMGETARLEPFKGRLSPEALARIQRILSERE